MSAQPVIACDFDGKIAAYAFPACGPPVERTVAMLRRLHAEGWQIIIHSSRVNSGWPEPERTQQVEAMIQYLIAHDIPFHEIWGIALEFLSSRIAPPLCEWWFEPDLIGKPVAHVYDDDRGLGDDALAECSVEHLVERCWSIYHRAEREHAAGQRPEQPGAGADRDSKDD
jgi:hypothetical protein